MTAQANITTSAEDVAQIPRISTDGVRLYVGGLDYSTQERHLAELLSQHGITSIKVEIPRESGRRLGFGFVKIAGQHAEQAIRSLDGLVFRGRRLRVERARPKNHGIKSRERCRNLLSKSPRRLSQ